MTNFYPIHIRQDIAQKIQLIATQREVETERLVTEILERFIQRQMVEEMQGGSTFLLSVAGIFDSGTNRTSEQVKETVSHLILKKHGKLADDRSY